jgi:hypothetical protein
MILTMRWTRICLKILCLKMTCPRMICTKRNSPMRKSTSSSNKCQKSSPKTISRRRTYKRSKNFKNFWINRNSICPRAKPIKSQSITSQSKKLMTLKNTIGRMSHKFKRKRLRNKRIYRKRGKSKPKRDKLS